MQYYTDCFIFGRPITKDILDSFNGLFEEEIFALKENKVSFVFEDGFYNIKKDEVNKIVALSKSLALYCLFAWNSDCLGWGYLLNVPTEGKYEFKVPLEGNAQKTEVEFISFCGIQDAQKTWDGNKPNE